MNKYFVTYKRRIRRLLYALESKQTDYFKNIDRQEKKVIVGLAADYQNLGDVAITYAQTKFLEDTFPDYQIIDFPISDTFKHYRELKEIINDEDIITLVGGGNTGDLYDSVEHPRQFLINRFPHNKIISFPQTVDFSDALLGELMLKRAKQVYQKHTDLTLIAREVKSYEFYKNHFTTNEVLLYPDIVLYLDESESAYKREGITLTLRNDKEKNIDNSQVENLVRELNEKYGNVNFRDTHTENELYSIKAREDSLKEIWDVFRRSSVVITDRLHGMIFCSITNTPCVAINNSNKKVQRVYEKWLKQKTTIRMIDNFDVDTILNNVDILRNQKNNEKTSNPDGPYEKLKELKEILRASVR